MFFVKKEDTTQSCTTGSDTEGHNCCSAQPKGKAECPECHALAKGVLGKTLAHLLKEGTKSRFDCLDGFYYCKTAACRVVYFRDEAVLTQDDLTVTVGLKEGAVPATVCYCFGWTKEKIKAELDETGATTALEDIKAKMENPGCSCEILNPSGGCCLGDVGKVIKALSADL